MYRGFTAFKAFKRVEGYRWLRSDGKPSFSSYVYEKEGDIVNIMTKQVHTASPSTPIGEISRMITIHNIRSIPITDTIGIIKGIIMAMDLVNYFGGGPLYNIVRTRHNDNIYGAFNEPASSIMNDKPVVIKISDTIVKALETMIVADVGVLPVVSDEGKVRGIVTERDLVEHFVEPKLWGIKVKEVMSRNVITIREDSTLIDAAEIMVKLKIRRLPVINDKNEVVGMITAKDYVRFFGSHEVFKKTVTGDIKEALKTKVSEVMNKNISIVSPDEDIGEAARKMIEENLSSLLVTKDNTLIGIITEKDLIYAVSLER